MATAPAQAALPDPSVAHMTAALGGRIEYRVVPWNDDEWIIEVRDIGFTVWSIVDGFQTEDEAEAYARDHGYIPAN